MTRAGREPSSENLEAELSARRAQRLHTAETLRQPRTPLQVIAVVENAVAVADAAVRAAVKRLPPRPARACTEGCAWCCHKVVGTAAAEVFRAVAFLRHCSRRPVAPATSPGAGEGV